MAQRGSPVRAILAAGFFGGSLAAIAGAVVMGVVMLLALLFAPGFPLLRHPLIVLVVLAFGTGFGFVLGAFGGFVAGTIGGCIGGPLGWALGGLVGGRGAGLIPSGWCPWPIETLGGLVGAAVGLAIGITIYAGESTFPPLNRLIGILNRSALTEWPAWQRWAVGLALVAGYSVLIHILFLRFSSPEWPGASLFRHVR